MSFFITANAKANDPALEALAIPILIGAECWDNAAL
jgi:hypothetical protein